MADASVLYLVVGILLVAAAVIDILWTALWADGGAGPLSSGFTALLWRGIRRLGGARSRWLSLAGPIILAATLFAWIVMIWAGWTFIFAAGDALIDTRGSGPLSWVERQYFVAYSMFTMGNGDFAPRDGWPQVATALTTGSGMLFVTMGVSYVLSVLEAVNQRRSFAGAVRGLGDRGEDVVVNGWNGQDLHQLDLPLNSLASQLSLLNGQHKSYPVLHCYHGEAPEDSSVMAMAILDEALTLMTTAVPPASRGNQTVVRSTQSTIDSYLEGLGPLFSQPADDLPPSPDLDLLRHAGLPTATDRDFARQLEDHEHRRRLLLGLVRADAWWWPSDDRPS